MSSRETQVAKGTQKARQVNPKQYISKTNKNAAVVKKIGSTRTGGRIENPKNQPASTFALKRELNQASLAYVRDSDQLPVQDKKNNPGRYQYTQGKGNKYSYNPSGNAAQNSRTTQRQVSSVGKPASKRYRSLEQQNVAQSRYQVGSPLNRRTNNANGNGKGSFNVKRWAFASKKEINKIIVIQRWWRYMLNTLRSSNRNRFSQSTDKSSTFRSKSSKYPNNKNISFLKQGENITEKIYPSKNNKLVVETRKVEVYRSIKPKSKQDFTMKSKDSRRFAEGLRVSKEGEHLTQKIYPGAGDTLIAEKRKVEVFKDKRKTKVTDSQGGKKGYGAGTGYGYEGIKNLKQYSESGEYADGTQKPQFKKKGEKITEKIMPGKNSELISETRKVEVFKDKRKKKGQDTKTTSKDAAGRYGESLSRSKDKYGYGEESATSESRQDGTYGTYQDKRKKKGQDTKTTSKDGVGRYGDSYSKSKSKDKYGYGYGEESITSESRQDKDRTYQDKRKKKGQDTKTTSKDAYGRYGADSYSKSKDRYGDESITSESRQDRTYQDKRQRTIQDTRTGPKGTGTGAGQGRYGADTWSTSKDKDKYSKDKDKYGKDKDKYGKDKDKYGKDKDKYGKDKYTYGKGEPYSDKSFPGKDRRQKTYSDLQDYSESTRRVQETSKYFSPSGTGAYQRNQRDQLDRSRDSYPDGTRSSDKYKTIGRSSEEKEIKIFTKQGENITEKIFPGKNNNIISETRKVEVFKNKRTSIKDKLTGQTKKSGKYTTQDGLTVSRDIYGDTTKSFDELQEAKQFSQVIEDHTRQGKIISRGNKKKVRFREEGKITKQFIKDKMRDIWLDDSIGTAENSFTYVGKQQDKLGFGTFGFGTFGTISTDTKGISTEGNEANKVNNLLKEIREKDMELKRVVNQLKSQLDSRGTSTQYEKKMQTKSFGSSTQPGKGKTTTTTTVIKKTEKFEDYDTKVRKLLDLIKEKDDKVNKLINQLRNQASQNNVYDLNRTFDSYDQRYSGPYGQRMTTQSRTDSRGREGPLNKSYNSQIRTQTISKSTYDLGNLANRTIDDYDSRGTQRKNIFINEDDTVNNRSISQLRSQTGSKHGYDIGTGTYYTGDQGDYEFRINQLETIIKEKDDELEKLVNQLNTQSEQIEKKPEFNNLDFESCYGLGILSDKQNWNDIVKECPINKLFIYEKKDWNEVNEITQLDLSIISLGKNWDDIVEEEGRDALFIEALEKEPLEHQKINLLQINGQPIFEKWLDQIGPNSEVENLEITRVEKTDTNVIEEMNGITILANEKEPNRIQNINLLYIQGEKRPWENLEEEYNTFSLTRQEKPENQVEPRDSIEITAVEREPLAKQQINALCIQGFERPELEIQRSEEMDIYRTEKPENEIEPRDSIEITAVEKEPLVRQLIDALYIAGFEKPENVIQATQEMEIVKTPKPENQIEENDSIEILGMEKEPLTTQLINQLEISVIDS